MKMDIMIIDDTVDQLEIMRLVFKKVDPNLQIVTVNRGSEAINILRSNLNALPKVILLDVRMPGKNGKDILIELKSDKNLKRIPVCMFSNGSIEADVYDSYENGASFYFEKPMGIQNLTTFVEHFKAIWFELASLCKI